ncbi:MAG TPA: 3-deoxy-D-manno-octulosonate 8-phosphate phosphatase [Paraburkholderia sp.]|uniref:KdsC family phosphatase n=1 Tax=Paraburkholderia sp. TaxID=1926495 RepID=UPI002C4076FD|nr:3-deoxy-D-manno-octulosonate 8-phosphate phosphatase [Paraburkholderia sp.]HTR08460.1 3-deoxy-D-manno-octulosonate 8-phosphate phosphatase [Paraburkholderia sp.]
MAPQLDATARAARVRLMIFDVDGVLTDGSLMFTGAGDTMKSFNSQDGHGAKLLREAGIDTAIITGRRSEIVAVRAKELKITHLWQGVEDKRVAFAELLAQTGVAPEECGYMGDDWPDLGVMLQCGFAAAPADAHADVLSRAHWVSDKRGGHGAVREVTDLILRAQNRYEAMLAAACAPNASHGAEPR